MPPKKKKATEPEHQPETATNPDTPVSPTDPLEEFAGDPFDIEGRGLLAYFDDNGPTALKGVLDALKEQQTKTVTVKAMKENNATVIEQLERILRQMGWVRESLAKATTVHARMIKIEQAVCNIETEMKVVPTITAKTWAEVTANRTVTATKANERAQKRQQRETLREERSSYEITLEATNDETRKQLSNMREAEITKCCQQAIEKSTLPLPKPILNGINKLAKDRIRLQCQTPEQAQSLHKVDWNIAFEGLVPYKRKYAIVIHGVPKIDVNFDEPGKIDATIKELENANVSRGLPITRITPLKRKATTADKPSLTHSIVVFTEDPKAADACIKLGFYVNYQRYTAVERYLPHLYITQCYKCYEYGHRASQCHHRKQKCSNCGTHHHDVTECTTTEPCCALCHGDHHPWAKACPERAAENRRLQELRMRTSPYFTS